MGFADLHIHTIHSYDGTGSVSAVLKYAADSTNLDILAITDHNTLDGVKEAMQLAPRYGLQVIPGCEITTADGHLIALFIDRPIQAGLSLVETVFKIAEQEGVCIAAHPTAPGTKSLSFEAIEQALAVPGVNRVLLGIEAFNGGLVYTRQNSLVEQKASTMPLAQVGSSDAHVLQWIGQGATEFEGRTVQDLLIALQNRKTKVRKGRGLDGRSVLTSYVTHFLLRKLGWVRFNQDPDSPLTYARLAYALRSFAEQPAQ